MVSGGVQMLGCEIGGCDDVCGNGSVRSIMWMDVWVYVEELNMIL